MGRFLLLQLNMHTWVVPATSAVEHVGLGGCCEAAPKMPPKLGIERESAVADRHKQREAMLASRSEVVARLGTLAIEPTFLTRVREATW